MLTLYICEETTIYLTLILNWIYILNFAENIFKYNELELLMHPHIWAQALTKVQQYYASNAMTDSVSTYFQDVICNKQVIMHEITTEKKFIRK